MKRQIINASTGEFSISENFIVSNKTTKEELIDYFGKDALRLSDMKNGHCNYTIQNLKIAEWSFILTFYFFNQHLTRLSFIVQAKPYFIAQANPSDTTSGWDNFNEAENIKEGAFVKQWFDKQMKGQNWKSDWGSADVDYDHHNLSTSCAITYKTL